MISLDLPLKLRSGMQRRIAKAMLSLNIESLHGFNLLTNKSLDVKMILHCFMETCLGAAVSI